MYSETIGACYFAQYLLCAVYALPARPVLTVPGDDEAVV